MSANVEGMVREGIAAFKDGRKEEARVLLAKAVELDQFNEQAWMWLSGCVDAPEDQRICLENVIAINPLNERARKGLAFLDGQNVDFNKPKPAPPPPPPAPAHDALPTSVEWEVPSDGQPITAAFSTSTAPISDEEYDNWVTGLNLPATGGAAAPASTPSSSPPPSNAGGLSNASPFTQADFGDDLFTDGPFKAEGLNDSAPASSAAPASAPRTNEPPPKRRGFEFGSAAAIKSPAESDSADSGKNKRAEAKRASREEKRAQKEEKQRQKAEAKQKHQEPPAADSIKSGGADFFMPEPAERDYTLMDDLDADKDGKFVEQDEGEGELFSAIPKEIKPTRLPGTREGYPLIGITMLIALIVFNLAALGALVLQVIHSL